MKACTVLFFLSAFWVSFDSVRGIFSSSLHLGLTSAPLWSNMNFTPGRTTNYLYPVEDCRRVSVGRHHPPSWLSGSSKYVMNIPIEPSAESAAAPPPCNKSEQSYLFNSCLLPFGVAHLKFLPVMRHSQTCLRQNIQCQAARRAVTCINNLEKSRLTNDCWDGMRVTLDFLLDQHKFHCLYSDLEATCYNIKETPITLISKSDRAVRASG